jgi:hypothetical protein
LNSADLIRELPNFMGQYLDGAEPAWTLPPFENIPAGTWRFRMSAAPGALVSVKVLGEHTDEMRITVGLSLDVPYSSNVVEHVNRLNNKDLIFGRMFAAGDIPLIGQTGQGPCAIVMQEIVFGQSLSFEFPPSMQNLLNVTARLAAQADRYAPELVEQLGGRLFADDDEMILTLY